jgi:hypothetical protein
MPALNATALMDFGVIGELVVDIDYLAKWDRDHIEVTSVWICFSDRPQYPLEISGFLTCEGEDQVYEAARLHWMQHKAEEMACAAEAVADAKREEGV